MQNYNAFCDRSLWFLSGKSTQYNSHSHVCQEHVLV